VGNDESTSIVECGRSGLVTGAAVTLGAAFPKPPGASEGPALQLAIIQARPVTTNVVKHKLRGVRFPDMVFIPVHEPKRFKYTEISGAFHLSALTGVAPKIPDWS
jgi:hypothetical protein